jgi:arsenite methyltransferase
MSFGRWWEPRRIRKASAVETLYGFHFHTGRPLARILGYPDEWLVDIPERAVESFAGTGNPFSLGQIFPGERVVDVGSGSGFDSLIAARLVGPTFRGLSDQDRRI